MVKTVVVKIGSTSLTWDDGSVRDDLLDSIAYQLSRLLGAGIRPVLVTSGAVAVGRGALGEHCAGNGHPRGFAAVGQTILMARYAEAFDLHGVRIGQVLFNAEDFGNRIAYLMSNQTLSNLLEWGVIPIVNENDTTSRDDIRVGENDRLAALIATMVKADLLVLLTDTAGLFSADPRIHDEATLLHEIAEIDDAVESLAGGTTTVAGSGGMAAKIAAAKIAVGSQIPCVIASAATDNVVLKAVAGESVGTCIRAVAHPLSARKAWLAFACPSRGVVTVDDGAADAICFKGRSLLIVGVRDAAGQFDAGDAVEICNSSTRILAKGISRYSAAALRALVGVKGAGPVPNSLREVVHRNDLVVFIH